MSVRRAPPRQAAMYQRGSATFQTFGAAHLNKKAWSTSTQILSVSLTIEGLRVIRIVHSALAELNQFGVCEVF